MSGHTPGPWIFEGPCEIDPKHNHFTFGWISTSHPAPIFTLDIILGRPEQELLANARLIAAAPEMYELLQRFVADFADYHYTGCPADSGKGECDCYSGLALIKPAQALFARINEAQ